MNSEIYTVYDSANDRTYIMKETVIPTGLGENIKVELMSWYFGEPDEESTKRFMNNGTTASIEYA